MTEMDFEELDRAVNSLMGDSTTGTAPVLAASTPNPSTSPQDNSSSTAPTTADVSGARRRGRFMDVVHPSSDMKTAASVSREGVNLAPPRPAATTPVAEQTSGTGHTLPAQDATSEAPIAEPEVPEMPAIDIDELTKAAEAENPTSDSAAVAESAPVADFDAQQPESPAPEAAKIEWPDPIDVMNEVEATKEERPSEEPELSTPPLPEVSNESPEENSVADVNEEEPKLEENVATTDDAPGKPMSSPFLPDAKVEKRPLGSPVETPEIALPGQPEENKPKSPPLPQELSGDVMKVEATSTASEVETVGDTPKTPVSINQQYAEQPSTGDQTNGPIYDTANYHKAVAHPAKKKSGWSWVIWIVVLLILGAAGGAAVFFFTT